MYKVHGYLNDTMVIRQRMDHIPRVGDTMRFKGGQYGVVTEVIWCMDEDNLDAQRVNIRIEPEEVEGD